MRRIPHDSPGQWIEIKSVGDKIIVTVAGTARECADMNAAVAYVNTLFSGHPAPAEPATSDPTAEEPPDASTKTGPARPR